MIKIFNSEWRGPGETGKQFGMILDFRFREYLHLFKGAKLAVFLALALHSDEKFESYPTVDTLARETGYERNTVSSITEELCSMTIDGRPVLAKFRERDGEGHFVGSMHYVLFPDTQENDPEQPPQEKVTSGSDPAVVNPLLKLSQKTKDKPFKSENENFQNNTPALTQTSLVLDSSLEPSEIKADYTKDESEHDRMIREGDEVLEILKTEKAQRMEQRGKVLDKPVEDLSSVQHFDDEVVMQVVKIFNRLWNVPIPSTGRYDKSRVKDWYGGSQQIISICTGHDIKQVLIAYKKWRDEECEKNGEPDVVTRPGSIVNRLGMFISRYKPVVTKPQLFDDEGYPVFYG